MSKLFTTRRRVAIVVGASAMVLAGGGAAFAYFTASGTGTGQATVGSASNFSVTPGTPTGTMLPGQGQTSIIFTVTNASTNGNQKDTTDTVSIPETTNGDVESHGVDVPGCAWAWFSAGIAPGTDNAQGVTFTPGQSETVTVTMSMSNAAQSQDACENVTPDVTLTVN